MQNLYGLSRHISHHKNKTLKKRGVINEVLLVFLCMNKLITSISNIDFVKKIIFLKLIIVNDLIVPIRKVFYTFSL